MHYNFLRRSEFLPHVLVYRSGAITPIARSCSAQILANFKWKAGWGNCVWMIISRRRR